MEGILKMLHCDKCGKEVERQIYDYTSGLCDACFTNDECFHLYVNIEDPETGEVIRSYCSVCGEEFNID